MGEKVRKTGIEIVGDASWGTHFCQFYQTKDDLIDILVPYFKTGLENNEFCMWITSEPLHAKEAKETLSRTVKDLDDRIKKGQIEILDYTRWYTKSGRFDAEEVLQGWVQKESQALDKGFDGLRLSGNTFWLERRDWKTFTDYEAAVNRIIGQHRMLAVCTYSLEKCTASDIVDVVSNHQFALVKREGKWEIIESAEHKKRAEAIQESEQKYRAIFEQAADSIVLIDVESGDLVEFNDRTHQNLGYTREEFQKLKIPDFEIIESAEEVARHIEKIVRQGTDTFETEHRTKSGRIRDILVSSKTISIGGRDFVQSIWRDITERKEIRARQELAGQILERLNQKSTRLDLIRDVIKLVKESTGFEAVGIRLREGEDFPYFEVSGFSDDFVQSENYLCSRNQRGEQIYDAQGRPVLECMCGSVIIGRADPALPFFTEGGSFWTNSTTELQVCTSLKALQVPMRNHCNEVGYESVALIPLRSGDEIVGLLQLNDTRAGRFTPETVRFFEEVGASIGIALARIRAEEQVENLAKFPSENPNPVLRIAKEGTVLYANAAGSELLKSWGRKVTERAPEHWHQYISRILKSGSSEELEIPCGDRIFSLIMAPVVDAGYVNVYGIDITGRKHAEEGLRGYREHLEELVQTRTAELTEANKQLLQEIDARRRLEKEILNISERERRRIGQELHDSLGQQLTGIGFMTKVLEQKLATKSPNEAADVAEIAKLVNQATDQARGLSKGLHPVDLEAGTLMLALQELATTTESLFGIRCTFECDKRVKIENPEVAIHLYRIAQEAITNAIKHGGAKNVQIGLARRRDKSVMTVKSDGLDFPEEFEARGTGMGLQIMDHRVDIIGGSLDIRKGSKVGTVVTCTFPNEKY